MDDDSLKTLLQPVLLAVLGPRMDSLSLVSGLDHYGEPAIYLAVTLRDGTARLGGELTTEAVHAVHAALLAAGDERFPLVTFLYEDAERAILEDLAARQLAS